MLTRRLPHTKCINASPRIRIHASTRLKIRKKEKIIKSKVTNGKWSRQNKKDFGVANLEPVERDKYSGFLWTGSVRTKRDPRKQVNMITSREVTSALELRAETTFLLVSLPDHKRKRRKEKKRKRNKYSLKTFSSFPLFFLDIWLSTTRKIYYLQRGTSEHSNPSWRFCFIKIV